MRFTSILHRSPEPEPASEPREPACFRDLNLGQVVASITAEFRAYDLDGLFYAPLQDVDDVRYRHEVFVDLQDPLIADPVRAFAQRVREACVSEESLPGVRYAYFRMLRLVDAVMRYCDATVDVARALTDALPRSRGLVGFRDFVSEHVGSTEFTRMHEECRTVASALASVMYSVTVKGDRVTVRRYEGERDYSLDVLDTFARFQQGETRSYLLDLRRVQEASGVQERILDMVARLFPAEFAALRAFAEGNRAFVDDTIKRFHREIQFYFAYRAHMDSLGAQGLSFSLPELDEDASVVSARGAFDIALATTLARQGGAPVPNDFELDSPERLLVVSGPNQGGKTTFARMVGQLHYLASLGCPVPAAEARLGLTDRVFTHFECEERIADRVGRLEDDLLRARGVLRSATRRSVVIVNEIFTSTALDDAILLGREFLERLTGIGCVGVYVTFVDELSRLNAATVSMVATVTPDDLMAPTYRVLRRPADGLAYAHAIAEKHGVTYQRILERMA